jgi:hypothetical protein
MLRDDLHDCREPVAEMAVHLKPKLAVDTGTPPAGDEARTVGLREAGDKIRIAFTGMDDPERAKALEQLPDSLSPGLNRPL